MRSGAVLLAAASLVACSVNAPGFRAAMAQQQAVVGECNAQPDSGRPQYIVGYGSLMQQESRQRTSPRAGPAHPIELSGYKRGWFARGRPVGFSTTYLGVVPDHRGRLNAVMYEVDVPEVSATDAREVSYCRTAVAVSQITALEPDFSVTPDSQAWIYVSRAENVAAPSAHYPIVQSYVDIFIAGCLEQEQSFALAGYSEQCVTTTLNWSEHWVNDRIFPRRPFVFQPRASQIDNLLAAHLARYFTRIRIEPPT